MIQIVVIALVFIILTGLISSSENIYNQTGSGCDTNFNNFCLTEKPRGFVHPLCSWWKNFQNSRLATGPPRTADDLSFEKVFRDKFVKVDNHSFPMPTQLDGYPLDVHDPFKKNFPPQKAMSKVRNPVIWNRIGVDTQKRAKPISKPLSDVVTKHNWSRLPFYTVPEFTSYHPDYYSDSSSFCTRYPRHRLCPNHWT